MGNDANMMGLGEMQYGAGRNCTDIVFLTIGTGIGGAIIIGGKLFSGYANRGAELGHTPLIANGERCNCGATGCLEHYASTSALVRHFLAKAKPLGLFVNDFVDGELIVRLYRERDGVVGIGIGNPCYVEVSSFRFRSKFLCEAGDFYLEELRKVVAANAIHDCAVNTKIVRAELGNHAGLIGAASQLF